MCPNSLIIFAIMDFVKRNFLPEITDKVVQFNFAYATIKHMSLVVRKPVLGFPTRSDTNRAVQLQKISRGIKYRIQEVEGLYYSCSENKGADQLRSYCKADLRLCFRICKKPVFS